MALIEERREPVKSERDINSLPARASEVSSTAAFLRSASDRRRTQAAFSFSVGSRSVNTPTTAPQGRVGYIAPTGTTTAPPSVTEGGIAEIVRARSSNWLWLRGESNPSALYFFAKRAIDILLASAALVVLAPLFLLVSLAVVLEDGGPVIYSQTRIGRNGKPFQFFKFRSMIKDADAIKDQLVQQNEASGPIFKMKNDPRITRVGRILRRSSIDELPQLLNILRGDMSIIGPRPHLPREVALYGERQKRRLSVEPGLVCLREVYGRSNLTFDQWIELDLLYIENRSFLTDLSILMRLIPAVLRGEGAY